MTMMLEDRQATAQTFFNDSFGLAGSRGRNLWKNRRLGPLTDTIFDIRLKQGQHYRSVIASVAAQPSQTILVIGVRSDKRPHMMAAVVGALQSERHNIVIDITDVGGRGKLENINLILARHDLQRFDWVIMTDDDILLPPQFVDVFLAVCALGEFKLAMPAHCFNSFSGYDVTRRGWGTMARQTKFVEVGPLTAFHRATFDDVFPLPLLRYGWGVDLHWPLLAEQRGWPMGVIDAVPMRHVGRIGGSYSRAAATDEACEYLAEHGHLSRRDTFRIVSCIPA